VKTDPRERPRDRKEKKEKLEAGKRENSPSKFLRESKRNVHKKKKHAGEIGKKKENGETGREMPNRPQRLLRARAGGGGQRKKKR